MIDRGSAKQVVWVHTDMESCVKICTRTYPCKSKSGV